MIDFLKTDILTKWHTPYVTMVGRRQFNIPISTESGHRVRATDRHCRQMRRNNKFGTKKILIWRQLFSGPP